MGHSLNTVTVNLGTTRTWEWSKKNMLDFPEFLWQRREEK